MTKFADERFSKEKKKRDRKHKTKENILKRRYE